VFGDIDGVIIIPRKLAYEVLIKAEKIKEDEKEIRNWVEEGIEPSEIVKRGGYF
jgi:regulator of RNase E activity RraA